MIPDELIRDHALEGARFLSQDRPGDARTALQLAVADGDDRPATHLNLAIAADRAGDAEAARQHMREIAVAFPLWDEPPLRLAESFRRSGHWPAAEQAYRDTLRLNPARLEALVALGSGLVVRDRAEEALPFLAQACAQPEATFEAWHVLGVAYRAAGDAASAEEALAKASAAAPDNLEIAIQHADAALAAGIADAELERLDKLAEASPLDPLPLRRSAHLLAALGRVQESVDALSAAADIAPHDASIAAALGSYLARLDRAMEAEPALRRALELNPSDQQARSDLAAILLRRLRFAESETLLRELIAERGESGPLLCNLANSLSGQGFQEEGIAVARRAAGSFPHDFQAWRTLTSVLPYLAEPEEQAAAARECARCYPRGPQTPFSNTRDPERPLRVGLLSRALRTHPVGWLTLAGWEALDPAAFELVCLGPRSRTDPLARRFAARASAWHDITSQGDAAVAALCRDLGIDVLVDLGGHGESGRLGVLAHRAAPIQIKWVGSQFGTSSLPEMDWFLTDRWETPPGSEDLYTEGLLRLSDGYVCYDPPEWAPDVTPLPALSGRGVTFGCFNNLSKITPEVIATWARILSATPTSRLVLKSPQFQDSALLAQVKARLGAARIDARQFELRGASAHRDHLAAYAGIDIVLDPFPYSGGLSTCEALWMGVPTITLPGRSFASRHTLSHQENAGLHGWAASSTDDYVRLAVQRASDLNALATLRAGLRAKVAASPLCDAPRFGRSLGAALRHTWQIWCKNSSPTVQASKRQFTDCYINPPQH